MNPRRSTSSWSAERLGARIPRDLDHQIRPPRAILRSPVAGCTRSTLLQTLVAAHRLDLPARQVLDALLGPELSARCRALRSVPANGGRAPLRTPRTPETTRPAVALSPPPTTTTGRPAKAVGVALDLIGHVSSERPVGRHREALGAGAGRDEHALPARPVDRPRGSTRPGGRPWSRSVRVEPRSPSGSAAVCNPACTARPSAYQPVATLRTEWVISVNWPPRIERPQPERRQD